MSENTNVNLIEEPKTNGKVTFANEVIAIIAALATSEVEGIAGMSGNAMSGITQMLGRKNLTKGVKVEVGTEEAAVDVFVIIKYGYKIQEVSAKIQFAIKNAIETMTGLRVVEVNVFVQGIQIEKDEPISIEAATTPDTNPAATDEPRVK